jgi:hypothetical protein
MHNRMGRSTGRLCTRTLRSRYCLSVCGREVGVSVFAMFFRYPRKPYYVFSVHIDVCRQRARFQILPQKSSPPKSSPQKHTRQ